MGRDIYGEWEECRKSGMGVGTVGCIERVGGM